MKSTIWIVALVLAAVPVQAAISGDYLEVRTSDVYTGPCFANGEVNLAGKEAILAWRVRQGEVNGVELSGLSVVAVVQASATLGDPFAEPQPARAVLLLDESASADQREGLAQLARSMAPELLGDVVAVETADIRLEFGHHGEASLVAGEIAEIRTRSLHHGDHLCGNETVYYPPLADVRAEPAYTSVHRFDGDGLNATWSSPFKRSAFIGTFSR